MILAVSGKGGVGKTTISAIAAKALGEKGERSLIVDADPAGGLAMTLDVSPKKTLNDVRKELIAEVKEGKRDERDLAVSLDYLLAEALNERGRLSFLSVGRPEDAGCYCRVNVILKGAIESLADKFSSVIIDAEAGVEQVNRQVLGAVDYVLLASDTSAKGVKVAETIRDVATRFAPDAKCGLVINRARGGEDAGAATSRTDVEYLGFVPEDETVRRFDEEGRGFLELPDCPAQSAIKAILAKAGLL